MVTVLCPVLLLKAFFGFWRYFGATHIIGLVRIPCGCRVKSGIKAGNVQKYVWFIGRKRANFTCRLGKIAMEMAKNGNLGGKRIFPVRLLMKCMERA
ncbi:hypothetical protein [Thalassospira mesophila]|uniref:Uncharacterized protein n=1 Tax=Thalassospira mesophila TaxID=1293891 RepID=A0A1Y2L2Q0_9PROT|nr:hypothetical protein [Thalassospira mesophila]OSQ39484.1 hypothetical protein TMES_05450 [Thalassospira mesophila]